MSLALKLTYYLIERAAEPVSNVIEHYAAQSPSFRATCTKLANWQARQAYNRDVRRLAQEQRVSELRFKWALPPRATASAVLVTFCCLCKQGAKRVRIEVRVGSSSKGVSFCCPRKLLLFP